ncbi:MAG: hypothetical protein IID37_13730 [Planctomycetes bacterium]|nr:hypothetical protein [Planctomycetota bacterium]
MSTLDDNQVTSTATRPDRRQARGGVRVGWRSPEDRPVPEGEFAFRCQACTAVTTASSAHHSRRVTCRRCQRSFWLRRTIRTACGECGSLRHYQFRLGGLSVPCESCGKSLTLPPAETKGSRSKRRRRQHVERATIRSIAVLGVLFVLCAAMITVMILNR